MPILSDAVYRSLLPRPRVRSWEWICEQARAHDGTRFDGDNLPWCQGVCDAFDDPDIREIALMWAARVGKTLICHSLLVCVAATDPSPMLFGSSTEALLKRIMTQKIYPMLEHCDQVSDQLRAPNRRSAITAQLRDCRIQGAWAGSESMLADYSARVTHANEVDKWDTTSSREGDSRSQFLKRSSEFPDRKNLIEGTPQEEETSYIEPKVLAGSNCRFQVPCKKCGTFQVLKMSGGDPNAGGIIWDKHPDGYSDPDVAFRTARYRCQCGSEWDNADRAAIIRAGIWVPAGQHLDKKGRLHGTPQRQSRIWSSQLAAYYSLDRTWGDFAEEFVAAIKKPALLKAFVQLTAGETWKAHRSKTTAEQLAERLCLDVPRGVVPEWARFLVVSCDVQEEILPFMILACGDDERTAVVEFGTLTEWDELAKVIGTAYPHADGGPPMKPVWAMIDSGHRTKEVYKFCRTHNQPRCTVVACKGASTDLGGALYRDGRLGEGKSKARREAALLYRGQRLISVGIDIWETAIQNMFDALDPEEPGGLSLCSDAAAEQDFLEQLLNATKAASVDRRGEEKQLWKKKNADAPNDFRDDLRYALCARAVYLDEKRGRLPPRGELAAPAAVPPPKRRFTMPDGRPFLITERS